MVNINKREKREEELRNSLRTTTDKTKLVKLRNALVFSFFLGFVRFLSVYDHDDVLRLRLLRKHRKTLVGRYSFRDQLPHHPSHHCLHSIIHRLGYAPTRRRQVSSPRRRANAVHL